MKVAALYDVHAMPLALEAALQAVEEEGVDAVVFGGDLICGPLPRQTLELANAVPDALFVRGNCDRDPTEWDVAEVDAGELRRLAELPLSVAVDGVLYCHAAPDDDLKLTTAATPDEVVRSTFAEVEEPVVVIGHTHHQFDRRLGDVRVVNAGSVGMPYEGEVAAFWTLVEDGEPSFRKAPFDVERAAAEIRASGWPGAEGFATENLLQAVSRDEAIAYFEGRRS